MSQAHQLTSEQIVAILRRSMEAQVPGPAKTKARFSVADPAGFEGFDDSMDPDELIERAVPDGWRLLVADRVSVDGSRWRYRLQLERIVASEPPFTPRMVLEEHERMPGEWQAIAIMLRVSYREFAQWMSTEAFADLEPFWAEERIRLQALRQHGAERTILRGPYTRRAHDLDELTSIGRSHLFAAPLAKAMVEQVNDGRQWPPVAVLRRYCETGHQGLLEHLRELDWVD